MSNFLIYEDRLIIAHMLEEHASFRQIGIAIGKDRTTISKEIKKHSYGKKVGKLGNPYNACIHRNACKLKDIHVLAMAVNSQILKPLRPETRFHTTEPRCFIVIRASSIKRDLVKSIMS
jgi:IS30 family transposase